MADGLASHGYALADGFVDLPTAEAVLGELLAFRDADEFFRAGVGRAEQHQIDGSVRGDYIRWIQEPPAGEATGRVTAKLRALMAFLNRDLFLSLRDFEAHYAHYPPGAFYEKHLDRFKDSSHRMISFVLYLNPHWSPGDGGELAIFSPESDALLVEIPPKMGRLAVFRSELIPHAVLPTAVDRYAITGWMLDVPQALTFL